MTDAGTGQKEAIMSAKQVKNVEPEIVIPKLNIGKIKLEIKGIAPLVCHRWSEKAKKEMLDKQMKVAKRAKEAKDPYKDFLSSLYFIEGAPDVPEGELKFASTMCGFPAVAFKKAAVSACRQVSGIPMTQARQMIFVLGNCLGTNGEDLVEIKGEVSMREDMVRIDGGRTADIRYRGQIVGWSTTLIIEYDADVLSAEQVVNLFSRAGWGVGIGEDRPEKSGGQWGRYELA